MISRRLKCIGLVCMKAIANLFGSGYLRGLDCHELYLTDIEVLDTSILKKNNQSLLKAIIVNKSQVDTYKIKFGIYFFNATLDLVKIKSPSAWFSSLCHTTKEFYIKPNESFLLKEAFDNTLFKNEVSNAKVSIDKISLITN